MVLEEKEEGKGGDGRGRTPTAQPINKLVPKCRDGMAAIVNTERLIGKADKAGDVPFVPTRGSPGTKSPEEDAEYR